MGPRTPMPRSRCWPLATRIDPELVPAGVSEGDASAPDAVPSGAEAVVGPYALQDFFLYYASRFGYRPSKIAFLASTHGPMPSAVPGPPPSRRMSGESTIARPSSAGWRSSCGDSSRLASSSAQRSPTGRKSGRADPCHHAATGAHRAMPRRTHGSMNSTETFRERGSSLKQRTKQPPDDVAAVRLKAAAMADDNALRPP